MGSLTCLSLRRLAQGIGNLTPILAEKKKRDFKRFKIVHFLSNVLKKFKSRDCEAGSVGNPKQAFVLTIFRQPYPFYFKSLVLIPIQNSLMSA